MATHDPFTLIIFGTVSSTKLTKYEVRENMKAIHFKASPSPCRTKLVFFPKSCCFAWWVHKDF